MESQARVVVVARSQDEVGYHWRRMANLTKRLIQSQSDKEM
jgi:hypothetical protein